MDTPTPTQPTPTPTATPPTPAGSSGNGMKILLIVIVVLFVLGILGAVASFMIGKIVSKGLKTAMEKATGVQIEGDGSGGSISITGKDGGKINITGNDEGGQITFEGDNGESMTFVGDGATLPDDFPSSFPIKDNLTLTSSANSQSSDGRVYILAWEGNESANALAVWYKTELPKRGWKITATTQANGDTSYVFQNEANASQNGWLAVATKENKAEVAVWLSLGAK